MAKKWSPSLKQLSAYDELLRRQNITRKRLLKMRRVTEEEGVGAPLPDLVLPTKAKRTRDISRYHFDSYEAYRREMKYLYENYSKFELSWTKQHYYRNYKDAILSMLSDKLGELGINFDTDERGFLKPEGTAGRFTKEQIEDYTHLTKAEYLEDYFNFYNSICGMSSKKFLAMYQAGNIPMLKYIYQEVQGRDTHLNLLDMFMDASKSFIRELKGGNVMLKNLTDFMSDKNYPIIDYRAKYKSDLEKHNRRLEKRNK